MGMPQNMDVVPSDDITAGSREPPIADSELGVSFLVGCERPAQVPVAHPYWRLVNPLVHPGKACKGRADWSFEDQIVFDNHDPGATRPFSNGKRLQVALQNAQRRILILDCWHALEREA